jgi:cytidylate kinase
MLERSRVTLPISSKLRYRYLCTGQLYRMAYVPGLKRVSSNLGVEL